MTIREANSFPCDGVNPPYCNCDDWTTNEQWGSSILIPTGDPTCYYIANIEIRDCNCGNFTFHQIRINGIEKVGNCGNVSDGNVFTTTYSFLLLIAKDLFGETLNNFFVSILSPGCYRWSGALLESCDPDRCCKVDYQLNWDEQYRRWEVLTVYNYPSNCTDLVEQGCHSMCDSVEIPVGPLPYTAWPISCEQTDPCPNVPWSFDPSQYKVFGKVAPNIVCPPPPGRADTLCNFVAFFEWKACPNGDILFRLKYIVKGPCCLEFSNSSYIVKAIKRILNACTDSSFIPCDNFSGNRKLLSYSCWTLLDNNYMIPIIAPCVDSLECCLVKYHFWGYSGARTLDSVELINSGAPVCTTQAGCYYMCDTLADSIHFPPGSSLPGRWDRIIPFDEEGRNGNPMDWNIQVVPNPSNRQVEFKLVGKPEGEVIIRIYNYLGVEVNELRFNDSKETTQLVQGLPAGLYTYVVLLNSERAISGTFIVVR